MTHVPETGAGKTESIFGAGFWHVRRGYVCCGPHQMMMMMMMMMMTFRNGFVAFYVFKV